MTEVQPFGFPATGQSVRTLLVDGTPWFIARDVTAILEIANGADALSRVSPADKGVGTADTPGGPQRMAIVNESGLYDLILESRKPNAREFRRWITSDVVPTIRRTGSYSTANSDTHALKAVLPDMSTPEGRRAVACALLASAERELELTARVAELGPAAAAWNVLATAADDYDVASAAQILSRDSAIKTGRGRLFAYLANAQWIYRKNSHWAPYQAQVDNGRLMVLPQSHYHPRSGELVLDPPQIRITVKGLTELHKRLGGIADVRDLAASAS